MIALYFDYQFVDLLNKREDSDDLIIHDFFNQFLRKIRGVEVYVNLNSLDELKGRVLSDKYWNYISEIGPITLLNFKPNLELSKFYKKGALSKIFFVEGCKETYLQKHYSSIFISNNSLLIKWPLFLSNREDNYLLIKSDSMPDETGVFKSWADLSLFSHPVRNIILCDFYIATDKINQRIKDNLIPLIQGLLADNSNKANDLAIFTKGLSSNTPTGSRVSWTLKDIEQRLMDLFPLRSVVDKIEFINYDSTKVKGDSEHNRFILTNYFMIVTEAGFNIFKSKIGVVNKRDNIRFDSLLKNNVRNAVNEITNNLKLYCSEINNEEKNYKGESQYFYLTPLQSRFLKEN